MALNWQLNGEDVLVPMVIEEPSVIAAASNAARLVRDGGGFVADSDPANMISQVELKDVANARDAILAIENQREKILAMCDEVQPGLKRRGGGARDVEVRLLDDKTIVVHLVVDWLRRSMGAPTPPNTIAEKVAPYLAELARARAGLRICRTLADRRCVRVTARVLQASLDMPKDEIEGRKGDLIVEASRFAELDPSRRPTAPRTASTPSLWPPVKTGAASKPAPTPMPRATVATSRSPCGEPPKTAHSKAHSRCRCRSAPSAAP